jgi:hypothetical protein
VRVGFSNKIAFSTTGACKLSQPGGTGYDNKAGAAKRGNRFFSSIFAKDKFIKHLTLFNVVFGLFIIVVSGIIRYSGLAEFILSFFIDGVSEVYSWGLSALLSLFVKLPCKGLSRSRTWFKERIFSFLETKSKIEETYFKPTKRDIWICYFWLNYLFIVPLLLLILHTYDIETYSLNSVFSLIFQYCSLNYVICLAGLNLLFSNKYNAWKFLFNMWVCLDKAEWSSRSLFILLMPLFLICICAWIIINSSLYLLGIDYSSWITYTLSRISVMPLTIYIINIIIHLTIKLFSSDKTELDLSIFSLNMFKAITFNRVLFLSFSVSLFYYIRSTFISKELYLNFNNLGYSHIWMTICNWTQSTFRYIHLNLKSWCEEFFLKFNNLGNSPIWITICNWTQSTVWYLHPDLKSWCEEFYLKFNNLGNSNNWTLSTVWGVDPDLKPCPVHFAKSADNSDGESDIGSPLKKLDKGKGKAISSDTESEDNRPTSKIDKGKGKAIPSDTESDNGEKSGTDENDLNPSEVAELEEALLEEALVESRKSLAAKQQVGESSEQASGNNKRGSDIYRGSDQIEPAKKKVRIKFIGINPDEMESWEKEDFKKQKSLGQKREWWQRLSKEERHEIAVKNYANRKARNNGHYLSETEKQRQADEWAALPSFFPFF